jgi:hypothetical protein
MGIKLAGLTTVVLTGAVLAAAGPAEAASTFHGCPAGAVCVYNGASLSSGVESGGMYWSYGAHNLHNQFGDHAVINNQTGGAWLTFCGGGNGTGPWLGSEAPNTAYPPYDVDLTPVNSIILTAGVHSSCP